MDKTCRGIVGNRQVGTVGGTVCVSGVPVAQMRGRVLTVRAVDRRWRTARIVVGYLLRQAHRRGITVRVVSEGRRQRKTYIVGRKEAQYGRIR